ncbi:DUF664 domain-containing protein [Actinoplanes sp. NPDC048988]|uniref:mycothiol transferase n=1 Tax=Actinoplanes sp. NPDC048988 TaxID=3363901 RepID=UPI0037176CF9
MATAGAEQAFTEEGVADRAVAAFDLDQELPRVKGSRFQRWVYFTGSRSARHNGHAALIRERMDGVTG